MFATETDACREYARNVGRECTEQAWILTHFDTWEKNPFYKGPPVQHPECEDYEQDLNQAPSSHQPHAETVAPTWSLDQIPF